MSEPEAGEVPLPSVSTEHFLILAGWFDESFDN
jgi:hypothetical protein